ncbi:MAG: AgmX/PglI C-terminal domain-containing protein [Gammaproteobacteria bacterium]|nr:AgmX/PglI C-terminal domain-containing protein [Gammaproteobacteria bacterium]MDH3561273.1 AgmX/PglI C-terminal domain-containing protein [Gammaproteobacteria bacterium]
MSATVLSYDMSWGIANSDDARFNRYVRRNLLMALVLGIIMPFLPLPEIEKPVVEEAPRLAQLIFEKEELKPPPQPLQKKAEPLLKKVEPPQPVKKKVVVKKPAPVKPVVTARQQAEKSGLLALRDSLSDLRQNTVSSSFEKTGKLSRGAATAQKTERAILTAGTARGSGGIQTANLSRNTGGGELSGRSTTKVHSPSGNAPGGTAGGKGKGSKSAGRSIEEIQMIFDRNKGSIYSVYNRALRKDPSLKGKIVLRLTIAPSGMVTRCDLVSSELADPDLGKKIASRVKLFDFGAKDVTEITITYPIDFLPA